MASSVMASMTAMDSTRTPLARRASPPPWKPFSMAMAAPAQPGPCLLHQLRQAVESLAVGKKIIHQQNRVGGF